ncbi:membrane-bound lytic murein transglycosylase MltF [Kineobactrum sediminis]|uniref:Membrane-bound lytic murein transglycosylase F n=1 Tax=Kineobactrum sediminis TaxID=1905677 RepID=A0A2N5XZ15_9GAMM|nr:membrane-bound lytic murein transglycosylase MltF [Kineobactrum sediminis]PLW81349.1 membrane-bound lytic murein transglycosylase MltF [Kineobactrum sediminis]
MKLIPPLLIGFAACVLVACSRGDSLQQILAEGELTVVSRSSPTTYYLDKNGAAGFEYDLAQLFADELGVTLKVEPVFGLQDIFRQLKRQEAHLAAAGLTLIAERSDMFAHSIPYAVTTPRVIYKTGQRRPRSLADIDDLKLLTLADSSHQYLLTDLSMAHPDLAWDTVDEADSMELLERIDSGEADLAVIDSNEFRMQQSLYPRLEVAFDLGPEHQIVWYLPPGPRHDALRQRVNTFFEGLQQDGRLDLLREQHFGHARILSRIGSHTFASSIRRKLPPYRALIQQVAGEYQLDWHLLAAIAYQESHWDPLATSPTGVRGLMMLTKPTAAEMGVTDRLDPLQSLRGGARYLKHVRRRLPQRIEEPDRTWLALAAYNVGMGHLEDARVLTQRHGGNPDQWSNVMEHLPMLQKREHYRNTRHGYARGLQAVSYVQNIRHYYSILQWQDMAAQQPERPLDPQQHLPETLRNTTLLAL